METLRFVIVGHVDHGKSTLIGRLLLDTNSLPKEKISEIKKISKDLGSDSALAFVTDQLKEEREQGKTIDTTQIFFKTKKRNYVIIDTPGHVEFIKNMITGASSAEAAILIIDVNEGIMEQTKRHAFLIKLLGINQIIVVFNKMDLINYCSDKFEKLRDDLLIFLKNLDILPLFFVPISAKEGVNVSRKSYKMMWYQGLSLLETIDLFESGSNISERPLRFPIQDVYKVGAERVIVGRLASGRLKKGQKIIILPSAKETKINSIKVFGKRNKKEAQTGESVGLVLDNAISVRRGEQIAEAKNPPNLYNNFKGNVFWLYEEPLKLGIPFTLRCAMQEVSCIAKTIEKRIDSSTLEVIEENARELKLNEAGIIGFETKKPIIIEKFSFIEELGRFAIEQESVLQGVGIII